MRVALLVALALLMLLAVGLPTLDAFAYQDALHPGLSIRGVDVGGLSVDAARTAVEQQADKELSHPLTLSLDAVELTIVPEDAGVRADPEDALRQAGEISAGALSPGAMIERLRLWIEPRDLPVTLGVSPAHQGDWDAMLDEVALAVERLPKDARMMLTDEGPKAVASEDGLRLERGRLTSLIVEAVAQGNEVVEIPVTVIAPTVTTDDARRALEASRLAFAAPVTLGYQGTTFTLTPQQLLAVAEVNPHGVASGLPLSFDTEAAEKLLGPYLATVVQSPVDAQITPDPDGRGIAVVPSSDGTVVEWEALTGALARAALSTERRYVPIPTTPAYPNLTTEEAEEFGIRQEIASFTTYFSPANQARVNNITQVARALDGVIVRPGETFSFNETVGPRTKAAGYDEAPVIRDGVLTPGVGGGICQVSTTLFNAAFFAGLPVVERHPHSFYIDHYPVGRDATVSYGSADLKFRNDSDQMLLIIVTATDRAVTASLAAPRWNRVVEYTTTPFHDLLPPHSSAQKPRKLRDPALASGEESMEEGVDGRSVEVVRRVLTHDGAPVREDTFSSRYSPKDYIIRVGG